MKPNTLAFPMNVYSALLDHHYGQSDYLCYGHGVDDNGNRLTDVHAAQALAVNQLMAALPGSESEVLVLTRGPGRLAQDIANAGHRPRLLTTYALGADRPEWNNSLDRIVIQDCLQATGLLQLLGQATDWLRVDGYILLSDEFAVSRQVPDPQAMLTLESVERVVRRFGFSMEVRRDNTEAVRAFLPMLTDLFGRYHSVLPELTKERPETLDALERELQRELRRYENGSREHLLLELRRTDGQLPGKEEPVIVGMDQCTSDKVQALFDHCFGGSFDEALWHWKYGEGRGQAIGVIQNGQLIAHYGGAARSIRYFGETTSAMQICDVMVMPGKRGFYSRRGHFFTTAATFLDMHVGYNARHLLGFGFPNLKAMHVAARLGLYNKTDDFIEIRFAGLSGGSTDIQCSIDDGSVIDRPEYDVLWQSLSGRLINAIVGERCADYMDYRYRNHPGGHYRFVCLRQADGELLALAVVREHELRCLLMDIVAAPEDISRCLPVLAEFLHMSLQMPLKCWITAGHAHWFDAPGSVRHDCGIEIPCNTWSAGPPAERLQGAWWLTAGDMDFL